MCDSGTTELQPRDADLGAIIDIAAIAEGGVLGIFQGLGPIGRTSGSISRRECGIAGRDDFIRVR